MSFTGLELVCCCINMGPVSSFMGNIVRVFLVTHHEQECDGVQFMPGLHQNSFCGWL